MTDANGRQHFVALFRKGNSAWVEIIAPDRTAFTRAFGIDKYDVMFDGWKPLEGLPNLNRFAVSTSDLDGKWTTNFSGMTQYVNVYTGASAGTKTYQSHQQYEFSGGHYNWKLNVVSGFVGSMNHQEVKSNGTITMPDNWNVHLSDIEGKPRDYAVFFTAVKDGRVLWIDGNAFVKVQGFPRRPGMHGIVGDP